MFVSMAWQETVKMNSVSIEEQLNNNFSNFNNHNIAHTCTECEVVGDQYLFLWWTSLDLGTGIAFSPENVL